PDRMVRPAPFRLRRTVGAAGGAAPHRRGIHLDTLLLHGIESSAPNEAPDQAEQHRRAPGEPLSSGLLTRARSPGIVVDRPARTEASMTDPLISMPDWRRRAAHLAEHLIELGVLDDPRWQA